MFFSSSRAWLGASVLAPSADSYVGYLRQHGYGVRTIRAYFHAVGHFARWLTERRIALKRIDEALVRRFLTRHLPVCRCPNPCKRGVHEVYAALRHLLRVLRCEARIPEPSATIPAAIREELERFDAHLDEVCGLAPSTRTSRLGWVRKFLHKRFGRQPLAIALLKPGDLLAFITRQAKRYAPGTAHVLGCALRSYLRFRAFHGDRTEALLAAIPSLAQWPQSRLPRHLTADELARFLDAFDQRTASGQRGYAMARCLSDLGLRASEVARLELDDLDWREGTLRIRATKSRRVDVLPLPVPTGQAIVRYLRSARPKTASRALFMRHRAPMDLPVSTEVVRSTVYLAYKRCGLAAQFSGTHVLRHTAATRMLKAGASLKDIADILRHRCLDTSTIYAKVDLAKLAHHCRSLAGERTMKRAATMVSQVEQYLALRRQFGFDLRVAGSQLLAFARFADASGHRAPSTLELAVRWARSSERAQLATLARRLEGLRPFAKYRLQFDPATEVPPLRLLGPGHRRLVPHIYTAEEIVSLLRAANTLSPKKGLRPLTYQTLFGLIAVTGLRVSEARRLTRADIEFDRAVLTVRNTKFHKSRLVPLHPTTIRALQRYAEIRDRKVPLVQTTAFFVSDRGKALDKRTVHYTFANLRQQLGWRARGGHPAPRIHDLRHTFICQALLRDYRKRRALGHNITALSTYVGHAKVTYTYWYVSGIPELMALAARRFERFAHGDSR